LIGAFFRSNPQKSFLVLACEPLMDTKGDASTVFVLIVTWSRYSGRCLSVPDP
jgi:hypothetical protein